MKNFLQNLKDLAIGIVLCAVIIGIFYFIETVLRNL